MTKKNELVDALKAANKTYKKATKKTYVFLVYEHDYSLDSDEPPKLVGVFSTKAKATKHEMLKYAEVPLSMAGEVGYKTIKEEVL